MSDLDLAIEVERLRIESADWRSLYEELLDIHVDFVRLSGSHGYAFVECAHRFAYECLVCNERRCMSCDQPTSSEDVKTAVLGCPIHREQVRLGR